MGKKIERKRAFIINAAYYAIIVLIVYLVFKYALSYLLPFVVAFALVSLLSPIVKKIQQRFPKKRSSISVVLMVLVYISAGVILFLVIFNLLIWLWNASQIISETYYPDIIKPAITQGWDALSDFIEQLPLEWQNIANNVKNDVMGQVQSFVLGLAPNLFSLISRFTGSIPKFVVAFIFTIMLSFFISIQYETVVEFFKAQLPEKAMQIFVDLKSIIRGTVNRYIGALLILMLVTCVELIIGLSILKVENPVLIAIGIALLDALPVLGTGTVLVPWMLVELVQGDFRMVVGLAIIYGTIALVRSIIEPKVVGDRLGMNPIVTMSAIYFGFKLSGVFGMLLMPIVMQILLELHRKGTIKLFKPIPKAEIVTEKKDSANKEK